MPDQTSGGDNSNAFRNINLSPPNGRGDAHIGQRPTIAKKKKDKGPTGSVKKVKKTPVTKVTLQGGRCNGF